MLHDILESISVWFLLKSAIRKHNYIIYKSTTNDMLKHPDIGRRTYDTILNLEKVQNRAARFVTGNYNFETGSMTSILEELGRDLVS